jgi:predicted DNA-binding antitoxin AbrB/MazE fold protein
MSQQIDAIYDHGVFKPLVPPGLPDQTRVRLTVDAEPAATGSAPRNVDFDTELEPLLFDGPNLPADFSRADIYADHD